MIRVERAQETTPLWPVAGAVAAAGAAIVWLTKTIVTGGSRGLLEVAALVATPIAAWIAWIRPLVFPYGLYAVVAPLDVLTVMSPHQGSIARLLGLLSAGALLLYALRTKAIRIPPRSIVWLALLCGWMSLSTLWSVGSDPAKEARTFLEISGLYLAVVIFPTRRRDITPVLLAIVAGGLVAALMGIYEFRAAGVAETQALQDFHRIAVSFGSAQLDPNMYADSLLLPFAIALAWFARARRLVPALLSLSAMGIFVAAIALAASRDAAIGLCLETIVLATVLRAWRRVALPVGAMVVAALVAFPNVILRAMQDNGGGYGRTSIWHVGLAGFLSHPIVGSGIGSFSAVYDRWYLRVFERYDVGWSMASHDVLVHYGVELGLVGLVLVVGWAAAQWAMARALPKAGAIGEVRAICLASLSALTFAAFFIDLYDVKFVWLLFALIAQARSAAATPEYTT